MTSRQTRSSRAAEEPRELGTAKAASALDGGGVESSSSSSEGSDFYKVERIVDRRVEEGDVQYLVKWDGWDDPDDMTWEPEEHLGNVRNLIDDFLCKKNALWNSRKRHGDELGVPANRDSLETSESTSAADDVKRRRVKGSDSSVLPASLLGSKPAAAAAAAKANQPFTSESAAAGAFRETGGLQLPHGWRYCRRRRREGEPPMRQPMVWTDPKGHQFATLERARAAIERAKQRQAATGNRGFEERSRGSRHMPSSGAAPSGSVSSGAAPARQPLGAGTSSASAGRRGVRRRPEEACYWCGEALPWNADRSAIRPTLITIAESRALCRKCSLALTDGLPLVQEPCGEPADRARAGAGASAALDAALLRVGLDVPIEGRGATGLHNRLQKADRRTEKEVQLVMASMLRKLTAMAANGRRAAATTTSGKRASTSRRATAAPAPSPAKAAKIASLCVPDGVQSGSKLKFVLDEKTYFIVVPENVGPGDMIRFSVKDSAEARQGDRQAAAGPPATASQRDEALVQQYQVRSVLDDAIRKVEQMHAAEARRAARLEEKQRTAEKKAEEKLEARCLLHVRSTMERLIKTLEKQELREQKIAEKRLQQEQLRLQQEQLRQQRALHRGAVEAQRTHLRPSSQSCMSYQQPQPSLQLPQPLQQSAQRLQQPAQALQPPQWLQQLQNPHLPQTPLMPQTSQLQVQAIQQLQLAAVHQQHWQQNVVQRAHPLSVGEQSMNAPPYYFPAAGHQQQQEEAVPFTHPAITNCSSPGALMSSHHDAAQPYGQSIIDSVIDS